MKILITVEGEKVTVEIDSKQLQLPLDIPEAGGIMLPPAQKPHRPPAPIFNDGISEGDKQARRREYNRKYREKQKTAKQPAIPVNPQMHDPLGTDAERALAHKVNNNVAPPSQFKAIVPGTPEYAQATRDDAEAGHRAERLKKEFENHGRN